MFTALRKLLARWFGPRCKMQSPETTPAAEPTPTALQLNQGPEHIPALPVPYDETLLEKARTQWQFGDWESLVKLDRDTLQHHPDRAKLALLAAAGHQQLGEMPQVRLFTRLALDWGCTKRLVAQILIAGTHNTLARAAAILGEEQRALRHFETAIDTGSPRSDRLVKRARIAFQLQRMGIDAPLKLTDDRIQGWDTPARNTQT